MRRSVVLVVGLVVLGGSVRAGHVRHDVRLHIRPRVCLAPCAILVDVFVPLDPSHRGVSLVWGLGEDDRVGSSFRTIHGADGPSRFGWPFQRGGRPIELRERGAYTFVAASIDADGDICARAETTVLVGPIDTPIGADDAAARRRRDR